ncbi:MAG: hypothetical protein C0502_10245 [Opitutus sp.]|nr:hypothetical protein [Opitutus sp.]
MKKTTKITTAAPKAATTKAPAKKTAASAAAATRKKDTVQREAPATFISARVDVGFGNHLYVRGEGPGLSWDHGVAMDCIASDAWAHTLKGATSPVIFKVLVNDEKWSTGNDYVVEPGQSVTITPTF